MKCYKNNTGFTLIELLVVIAIISLLSSVVMSSLNSARSKARDAQRVSDVKQFQLALGFYYDKYGRYIDTMGAGPIGVPTNASTALAPLVTERFIPSISASPKPLPGCGYWGNSMYVYGSSVWDLPGAVCPPTANNNSYAIEFCLENPSNLFGTPFPNDGCGRYCYAKCVY